MKISGFTMGEIGLASRLLVSRPDSTVGGKLTNHSYHFKYLLDIFHGHSASRFGGNLCFDGHKLFHAFSSVFPRCFHLHAFKTSVQITSDEKTASSYTQYCMLWQYANIYANNATVPRQLDFSIEGTTSVIGAFLPI